MSEDQVEKVTAAIVDAKRSRSAPITGDEEFEARAAIAAYNPNERLREALAKLTFAARTSGGTAGRDEALCAACDEAEALLSLPTCIKG